nr:reverse transcriptase domain-containing protein [Tanacetum cinerariifolium]
MKRFKVETGSIKGAPECMRIFGFMHEVNNSKLTKRLNKQVPKTMKEMMITIAAFIRGEAAAAGKKKGHTSWRTQDQSKRHILEKRTPKKILATEAGKFQPPPPMVTPIEKRSSNKFCDFHNNNGHSTDECMQLKKQIEELVRAGKLSHLIKEIKQGRDQSKFGKNEAPAKEKPMAIYMIQSWQRMTRQKVTQSFERVREITFPSLATNSRTEGQLVIEVKIGGHMIHLMYVYGGSSTEALGNNRRRRSFYKSMDEFHDCKLSDMTRVPRSVARRRLNIREEYSPVRQKKRGQALERVKAIQAEDCYPLLEIDWKVESLCGYPFKCFMDAYKGYHQIQLAESDEEKTAFHTGQGVYCYTKMSFGLKNASATYQRLVDKAFDNKIGRNIEVYVDDLVIKSHTKAEMLRDIGETFRMFLGYMITPERIKPCPQKTEAVLQLPSPRTIKEVQSLNGKLASLNIFLSKSVEKSLPLFKTLKKCIKKSDFHWTSKAEQAFKQLKQHLSELPLLVTPKPKEELIVYMFASYGAISAVLMNERGTVQTPVYFVSRALQGPELNYTPMETLVLSLVFAAKRLRRYFQAHPVAVITDQPIKPIMSRPDVAGRLQKQSVMLGEHNITYRPRTSVKGQVLADFLAEMSDESPPDASVVETQQESWTLFTDGSSCVDRSCAGLILTSPEGTEFTYALRFQFAASNNEAEYEALIAGKYDQIPGEGQKPGQQLRQLFYKPSTTKQKQESRYPEQDCVNKLCALIQTGLGRNTQRKIHTREGGKVKFLIVAIDYFTKWIEAKAVATITGNQSSHGDTPFSLTYGMEAVIPAKIGMPTYRTAAVDVVHNDEELPLNLDFLEERLERVAIHEASANLKMAKYYNARVRGVTFRPGDFV